VASMHRAATPSASRQTGGQALSHQVLAINHIN